MTLGMWVVLLVVGFAIGNMMAIKPRKEEARLGEMRMLARRLQLNPKLVAIPAWLIDKGSVDADGKSRTKLVMQYSVIDDGFRLPALQFRRIDGVFVLVDDLAGGSDGFMTDDRRFGQMQKSVNLSVLPMAEFANLPIFDYILGVATKANAVQIYWQDERFGLANAKLDDEAMTKILSEVKLLMTTWANQTQKTSLAKHLV